MERYNNTIQESNGDIITTATVTVYLSSTGAVASIFADNEVTALNNPFTVSDSNYDTDGSFWFKADNALYDIKVNNGSDVWTYDECLFDYDDTTTIDGALTLGNDITVNGDVTVEAATDSSSPTTGSIQTDGGLGVVKKVFLGDTLDVNGDVNIDSATESTATTNGSLQTDGGLGVVKTITVGTGIKLGGTASANLLNDYFKGTFTPVLSDGTNNATAAVAVGKYSKIGDEVSFLIIYICSSLGSVSGAVRFTGLPEINSSSESAIAFGYGSSLAISAGTSGGGFVIGSGSYINLQLWDAAGGVTDLQAAEVSANGFLMVTGKYFTS